MSQRIDGILSNSTVHIVVNEYHRQQLFHHWKVDFKEQLACCELVRSIDLDFTLIFFLTQDLHKGCFPA